MSLYVSSLNSGSNGNCYYIGNDEDAILVDVGISCREVEKRIKRLGLSIEKIRAIFVSHEHSDHICGIPVLSRKLKLPVYITKNTLLNGGLKIESGQVKEFCDKNPVSIGHLQVVPFSKLHDAADPYSFIIKYKEVTVGVFTDIGHPCENVTYYFSQCHAAFLEANYDEDMLDNGNYPFYLKNRIKSSKGHLSNRQAFELFKTHRHAHMSHLFLSHLSKNNNHPDIVQKLFTSNNNKIHIEVASRFRETNVYHIKNLNAYNSTIEKIPEFEQLSFSF